jgi:transposase
MSEASIIEGIKLEDEDLRRLLERIADRIDPADFRLIQQLAQSARLLLELIQKKSISIRRLRSLIFGPRTEKARNILPGRDSGKKKIPKKKRKGRGRNGAQDYPGAPKIPVPHEQLSSGDSCPDPECDKGKLYRQKEPGIITRFLGQPFIQAAVYELEKLRCSLCGKVYTAKAPEEAGTQKYDESVGSMISLLHYGAGVPFYRIEKIQKDLGVPLPASTQWEIGAKCSDQVYPVFEELLTQAAQSHLVHNDDTGMKILSLIKDRDPEGNFEEDPIRNASRSDKRKGIFTTGIIAEKDEHKIALFFTGTNHAGENLNQLLRRRLPNQSPPIQMCDGLSRNLPADFKTILGNCLTHGRRGFADILENFPDECGYVIDKLGEVYRNDALAKSQAMTWEQRLIFHRQNSEPIMDDLHEWMNCQLDEKRVEPNSSLGKAISYMLKRWKPLTLFLRKAGAPLDNNICERGLKMAILHRKNSLFYKTENGARVGDMFMSFIHTCRLCGANPFQYITQLQKNAKRLLENPSQWMPWNYRKTMQSLNST